MMDMNGISPTGVPPTFVVVWEWENRPNRWRPYSPEVTQLLERAHHKKLNKIYLKDADPLLSDYYINMTTFEQWCEPTEAKYSVRREFYSSNSPAGKGAKWEWGGDTTSDWHTYDMEVQVVIEEAWNKGDQTIDISQHFPGCPYIMNFCNLTQVRKNNGAVRPIRRVPQPSYPMVKLTQAEIASMIHRKEERKKEMQLEFERRQNANNIRKKKKKDFHKSLEFVGATSGKGKKAVKNLMNQIFHHKDHKEKCKVEGDNQFRNPSVMTLPLHRSNSRPLSNSTHNLNGHQNHQFVNTFAGRIVNSDGSRTTGSSYIGNPASASEFSYPVIGRRYRSQHPQHHHHDVRYRRIPQESSYSSFTSDTTSSIVRRPSVDTISTYLSQESMFYRQQCLQQGYRYQSLSYRSSLGSQEILDVYGDADSVFTDESYGDEGIKLGDSVSVVNGNNRERPMNSVGRYAKIPMPPREKVFVPPPQQFPPTRGTEVHPRQRVLSDPSLPINNQNKSYLYASRQFKQSYSQEDFLRDNYDDEEEEDDDEEDEDGELYVNQKELRGYRYGDARLNGQQSPDRNVQKWPITSSQFSLNESGRKNQNQSQPIHQRDSSVVSQNISLDAFSHAPVRNAVVTPTVPISPIKKRPVPTPRTKLNLTLDETKSVESAFSGLSNVSSSNSQYTPVDKLIMKYAQFVIDPNAPEEFCLICHLQLEQPSPCDESDKSVVCLTLCHHKFHLPCLKSLVENQVGGPNYIECPNCQMISGEKWGNMPGTGSMSYKIVPKGLPGYEDYHTIQITYNFQNGIQGPEHPMSGQPFYAIGFPRNAFLPDTEKGRKALALLEKAFNRRLTFTIGLDPITGQHDVLTWNNLIEHKTEFASNNSDNGYPDPEYLDRVLQQLSMVVEEQEHDV